MKKIQYFSLLTVLMAMTAAFSSCDKQLSAVPGQSKVYGNLIVDASSAEVALNGAYYSYALCGPDMFTIESAGNPIYSEILPATFGGMVYDEDNGYLITHGESAGPYIAPLWETYYKQLAAANYVISAASDADDKLFNGNRKKEIIALYIVFYT